MKVRVPRNRKENLDGVNNYKLGDDEYQKILGNSITTKDMDSSLQNRLGLIFRKGETPIGYSSGEAGSSKIHQHPDADNVLEFALTSKKTYESGDYYLLDAKGKVQMHMHGGELIFSRPSTKRIIDLALKATDEEGLFELGKFIYNERMAQLSRKKQYVKV